MSEKYEALTFSEFINKLKIEYPSLEERYSIIENITIRDEKGKLSVEKIKRKAYLTLILMTDLK